MSYFCYFETASIEKEQKGKHFKQHPSVIFEWKEEKNKSAQKVNNYVGKFSLQEKE